MSHTIPVCDVDASGAPVAASARRLLGLARGLGQVRSVETLGFWQSSIAMVGFAACGWRGKACAVRRSGCGKLWGCAGLRSLLDGERVVARTT